MKISIHKWTDKIRDKFFSSDHQMLFIVKSIFGKADGIIIALAGLLLAYGRWPSIVYPIPLNPDEAQAAANALRIKTHGFNWDVMDGTTVGPLNSMAISWPHFLGLDVTFSSTRFTATIFLFLVCTFVYFSLRKFCSRWISILFLLPLVIFYSFTGSPEFLHYSSEILPLLLLVAANYLALTASFNCNASSGVKFALLGFLAGCVPFAKLQAFPVAMVTGIYALLLAITSMKRWRLLNVASLVIGAVAPTIIFLVPLYWAGKIQDFWQSYIVWAGVYINNSTSVLGIHSLIASDVTLAYVTYFLVSVWLTSLLHGQVTLSRENLDNRIVGRNILYLAALTMTAFWVIAKPGNLFPHYLMFYPPLIIVFFCGSLSLVFGSRKGKFIFTSYYAVFLLLFVASFSYRFLGAEFEPVRSKYKTTLKQHFVTNSPRLLSWLPTSNGSMLVWGWMPQWYVWSSYAPATRESHTYAQITSTKMTDYFRRRFIKDLQESDPQIIIDAVLGNSFGFNDPNKYSPNIFPEFSNILQDSYFRLLPLDEGSKCPKIYVKKELNELIYRRIIVPASISASDTYGGANSDYSVYNLFDLSLTEDSCIDYWLLPNNSLGSLALALSKVEPIASVMILNTRNSHFIDRSTGSIVVKFKLRDNVVASQEVSMRPYPYWTFVSLDAPIDADSIEIDVTSFNGLGSGLNEIKILRAEANRR